MAKKKTTVFVCSECGYDTPKWQGRCPNCGQWNTIGELAVPKAPDSALPYELQRESRPKKLAEIETDSEKRISIGMSELDRVLGGGLVCDSVVLISGEPGIGKSTLLLQACARLGESDSVLYVTGEESLSQIKLRASRLGLSAEGLFIFSETHIDAVIAEAERMSPSVMVIDSIQTLYSQESDSSPGSIVQVRDCALKLIRYAKAKGIAVLLVGHVNKDGGIAGPKVLEHMVDAVLNFEGDHNISFRILRAVKNRFGSTNEIGMFEMTGAGLMDVTNPSAALLEGRPRDAHGSCVAATLEGRRPILAEIQGLVTKSAYGAARRNAIGIDYNRAVLLLAILEKTMGFKLGSYDAYLNVVGGFSLNEPAVDLPVLLAIASSYLERPIPATTAAFGEIGLSGEIRAVLAPEMRVQEVRRLGFTKCILPKPCFDKVAKTEGIELIPASNIGDAVKACFT